MLLLVCGAASALADGVTNSGDDLRDGWYPNQPRLSPDAVADGSFGQLWRASVSGSVYAQPLVSGNTVYIVTEKNQVYALDSETGAVKWTRDLGTPFPATKIGSNGCTDLTPDLGITSTPVIDTTTGTLYLTHKTYAPGSTTQAALYMDALDASTGATKTGFPRRFEGTADNAPGQTFQGTTELQRPGLLLMGGVVYAGFGGHCDILPYQGWVFGVNASTGSITARWSALTSGDGAGIWQSGAGLMSDGPGRLFVSTGNGGAPGTVTTAPGNGNYGESIVRLDVQPDGTLRPMDFFAPADAAHLDAYDADFASGGVTALRDDDFGTSTYPHVGVAVGKAGYVYLLNRDDLGGAQTGIGRGDRVIERVGPYGGVWSRPSVWPGDGGWIAIPTASPAAGQAPSASGSSGKLNLFRYRVSNGVPSLDAPVTSDDAFGFSSSAPVITSDGTTSGSATMWIVWAPDGSGNGAQLRAYDAVPINGHLRLRKSFPIGQSAKFATPGVGSGRMYAGTRDGKVYAYGSPIQAEVQAPSTTFDTTTVGDTTTTNVPLRIAGNVHVTSVTASPAGTFTARPASADVPGDHVDGDTLSVPVDFTPTDPGTVGGMLTVVTDEGTFTFSLAGTGQGTAPLLTVSSPVLSFGGVVVGDQLESTVTLGNGGGQPLTITGVELPEDPFSVDDAPQVGDTIAPGDAINLGVQYAPTEVGDFDEDFVIHTTGGDATVGLSGSAGTGPKLSLSAGGWAFGDVPVGSSADASVVVTNDGDAAMTVTKSKPPSDPQLTVVSGLDEGTTLAPGESRTVTVRFTPAAAGPVRGVWTLNAADGSGVHDLALDGNGTVPAAPVVDPPATTTDTPSVTPTPAQVAAPAVTVPSVGIVSGGGAVVAPAKVLPGLRVTKATLSRDARKLAIRGIVAKNARGPVGVTVRAKVGKRLVTVETAASLPGGRSTYAFSITLPKTMRKWTKITISVRFPGSQTVWPATAVMVVTRGR
jgi:iron transport multicopper oxidase